LDFSGAGFEPFTGAGWLSSRIFMNAFLSKID